MQASLNPTTEASFPPTSAVFHPPHPQSQLFSFLTDTAEAEGDQEAAAKDYKGGGRGTAATVSGHGCPGADPQPGDGAPKAS